MWIKKDPHEISKDNSRIKKQIKEKRLKNSLQSTLGVFLFGVFLSLIYYTTGYTKWNPSSLAPSKDEIYSRLPIDISVTVILCIFTFFFIYYIGYKYFLEKSETEMCDKCNSKRLIAKKGVSKNCGCGGKYYILDHFYWRDEQ